MASSSPGDGGEASSSSLFEGMVLFAPSNLSSSPPPPPAPPAPPAPAPSPPPQDPTPPSPKPLDEDLFADLTLLAPSDPPPITTPSSAHDPSDAPNHGRIPRQISRKKKRASVRIGYAREPPAASAAQRDIEGGGVSSLFQRGLVGSPLRDEDDASSSVSSTSGSAVPPPTDPSLVSSSSSSESPLPVKANDVAPVYGVTPKDTPSDEAVAELVESSSEDVVDERRESEGIPGSDDAEIEGEKVEESAAMTCKAEEGESSERDDAFVLTEGNLELIRTQIAQKMDEIREMAALACVKQKQVSRKRREVGESVNSAATRYKDLEKQLEEACEAEDFEKAERVSEDLAAAEKEKDELFRMWREAEVECDSVEERMHQVFQMQVAAEEEGARLLEQFAKDAAEDADLILKNTKEFCSKKAEKWQQSLEALELKKLEIDVEMSVVDGALSELDTYIGRLIEDDKREKEILCKKQDTLVNELEELLELVKLKEAEVTQNRFKIEETEKKISNVVNGFDQAKSDFNVKYDKLQSSLSKVEAEGEVLFSRKKDIDGNLKATEHKCSKLTELAQSSLDEAKTCHELVALRKHLASPILKSMEDRMNFATTEKKISEEIQQLREDTLDARSSLQELSVNRSSIQEEITSLDQRMTFIDRRVPELEAEKKVAAATRNFKEAGRVAAEAKALISEKESVHLKIEEAVSKLGKMEEEILKMVDKVHESEGLIVSKEKEAATAGYQRLCLVAAAARAERLTALTLGDLEEGNVSLNEVEAAESKAKEMLESYGLDVEKNEQQPEDRFSLSLLINLSGKRLALLASSLDLPETTDA